MSPEEIREAREVADWIQRWDGDGEADGLIPNVVAAGAFARAYALLLENGEQRWWCDQHKQAGDEVGCLGAHMVGTPCRMGRVLVVPLEEDV